MPARKMQLVKTYIFETTGRFAYYANLAKDKNHTSLNKRNNQQPTSYYSNNSELCSGMIDYRFPIQAQGVDDYFIQTLKAQFLANLQISLNNQFPGQFYVTSNQISYSDGDGYIREIVKSHIIQSFKSLVDLNSQYTGIIMDENLVTINEYGVSCRLILPSGGSGGGNHHSPYAGGAPFEVIVDSLMNKYPCLVTTVLHELREVTEFEELVFPFNNVGVYPSVRWNAKLLPWNTNGKYSFGQTGMLPGGSRSSSEIFLNSKLIEESSAILVGATMIHEMFHGFVSYLSVFKTDAVLPHYNNFLTAYEAQVAFTALMAEGDFDNSTHRAMLDSQIDNFAIILQKSGGIYYPTGNYNYSITDARKAILVGIGTNGSSTATPALRYAVSQAYNRALARYNLTNAEILAFAAENIHAPVNKRVPINCP